MSRVCYFRIYECCDLTKKVYLTYIHPNTYQSGIIVSQDAHSDRFPLESLGECLTKMSIANSSYSSLCCGLSSSKDSSLIKAREVVPKARLAHEESAKREYMSSWLKISS